MRDAQRNKTERSTFGLIGCVGAVLVGALLMPWPAFYNGYPLLDPDSMSYLEDGPLVARAVFLHKFSANYGGRSFIYCLGILPLHWNVTPWPIVGLNVLLTAYVLWLVVRSILPRKTITQYFLLVASLSLLTSLGWFVSLIMPDIYGPVLYLSIYLLVFAPETLSRAERLSLVLMAWWSAASHITHLMLASGLCVALGLLVLFRRGQRARAVAVVAMTVVAAAGAHEALHAYLYGKPSLTGERPPFVLARVIVDGPGRWYLQQRCQHETLAVCNYLKDFPNDVNAFLWNLDGIWQTASPETRNQMRQEEASIVWGTVRAYPRQEALTSAAHFREQLTTFDLGDYGPNAWVLQEFDKILPGARSTYLRTPQARDELPDDFSTSAQDSTLIVSLVLIAVFAPSVWRRRHSRLIGLSAVVVFVTLANALVTGVLSNVEARYESRVIWLVPLLAILFVLQWLNHKFTQVEVVPGDTGRSTVKETPASVGSADSRPASPAADPG